MIRVLDAHTGALPHYQLCIVGSGPAGMTVARELQHAGLAVALVESGRLVPTPLGDELRKLRSEGIDVKDHSRERVLGGASSTWAGLSSPLDAVDLERRTYLPHDIGWPLAAAELDELYAEAAERFRFATPDAFGPAGFGALESRGDVQVDWQEVETKIFLAAAQAQHFGREHREVFDTEGVDLWLDATVTGLEGEGGTAIRRARLATSGGREFALEADVFVIATGGIENARLLLASQDVCRAGLGNEHDQVGRYLMNHPKSYHGMLHLVRPVRELPFHFGCLFRGWAGYAGLRLPDDVQRARGLVNAYVRFEPLFPWSDNRGIEAFVLMVKGCTGFLARWQQRKRDQVVAMRDYSETGDDSPLQNERKTLWGRVQLPLLVLLHLPMVLRYVFARLGNTAPVISTVRLRNFMEMEAHPDNRVLLDEALDPLGQRRAFVQHATSVRDRASLVALHEVLGREVERTGFATLESCLEDADPWPVHDDASHHMGTTRMGTDPATSVVDPDGKLHGIQNVFMAGTSVFPTSGTANPTFTIVALSIRLARHLRTRFGVREPERAPLIEAGWEPVTVPAFVGSEDSQRLRVLVVGAGRRVSEDVLPALWARPDRFDVVGVAAKHGRRMQLAGREVDVLPLEQLAVEGWRGVDLIHLAVTKQSVPRVAASLAALGRDVDLLVDTPVLPLKQLGHIGQLSAFRRVWVAEDCAWLPWLGVVRAALGPDGVREMLFDRSAWRYHAVALMKALAGGPVRSARRRRTGADGAACIDVRLVGGVNATLLEPRDYDNGHLVLRGTGITITDAPERLDESGTAWLRMDVEDGCARALRVGEHVELLSDEESRLLGPVHAEHRVTQHTAALKRVGLLRLLLDLADGRDGYPLSEGLDDMAIDALLEKLGRYLSSPVTSLRTRAGRGLLGTAMKLLSRG